MGFADFDNPPESIKRTDDHYMNWVNACKTGGKTDCPVEYGCDMTEVALLGALALRSQWFLEWDADAMQITNGDEAINGLVDPDYREGWTI